MRVLEIHTCVTKQSPNLVEEMPRGARHRRARRVAKRLGEYVTGLIGLTGFLLLWSLAVKIGKYPSFILPGPEQVYLKFVATIADGTLWRHAQVTLFEIIAGLALGMITAICVGYLLAKSPFLERLLAPYVVASESIPIVALAPLLVIWFGFGSLSKILICALIVFFPVLVNTIVGIRAVELDLHDLMRSLQASPWQTFTMLELPAAMPVLFGGVKLGVTLSVIGAVVGEFVGADRGLGALINIGRGLLDTPLMFVALFTLIIIALSLYGIVVLLENRLLAWHHRD